MPPTSAAASNAASVVFRFLSFSLSILMIRKGVQPGLVGGEPVIVCFVCLFACLLVCLLACLLVCLFACLATFDDNRRAVGMLNTMRNKK